MTSLCRNTANVIITILSLFFIVSAALLLGNVSVNQSPTLEQMLSPQDRNKIDYSRQLFNVESEPVIIAISSPSSRISSARLLNIETLLKKVDGISSSISSASLSRHGLNNKQILSLKNNTELILLLLEPGTQDLEASKELSGQIRQGVETLLIADESALITGLQQIRAASWSITNQDLKLMLPLLVALTIVITLLFFNSYTALALSLLLASLTTAICLTGHALLRAELNMLIILVIPVIWAIATLDAFHLYSRSAIKSAQNDSTPVESASRELFIPCLLTTITTAACFLTLTLLDTSPLIATLGIWGAVGSVIAFVLTFTIGVKLLSMHSFYRPSALWPGNLSVHIVMLAQKHNKLVILFWLACLGVSIAFIPRLQISTPFPQVFSSDQPIASEIKQLKLLTGTDLNALDIIIEAGDAQGGSIQSLASAALLTSSYLHSIEETRSVLPLDLVDNDGRQKLIEQWRSIGRPDGRPDGRLPKSTAVPDTAIMDNWINQQSHAVRLQAYMAESNYQRKQEIFNWLRHFDETMLSHHKITLSGAAYFQHLIEQQGLKSLLYSSLLCLLIVGFTLWWITRNYLRAAIALSASIIPALMMAACMVMFDIPWSITLLPLPAILLGLMADDTIHILWFSRRTRQFDGESFRHNAMLAGPALLATTLVLSCASATLMLSGLQANQYLGMLIPLALLIAFLCNLSLLPAVNFWLHRSTRATR